MYSRISNCYNAGLFVIDDNFAGVVGILMQVLLKLLFSEADGVEMGL